MRGAAEVLITGQSTPSNVVLDVAIFAKRVRRVRLLTLVYYTRVHGQDPELRDK